MLIGVLQILFLGVDYLILWRYPTHFKINNVSEKTIDYRIFYVPKFLRIKNMWISLNVGRSLGLHFQHSHIKS
jgi:hypothetical protein